MREPLIFSGNKINMSEEKEPVPVESSRNVVDTIQDSTVLSCVEINAAQEENVYDYDSDNDDFENLSMEGGYTRDQMKALLAGGLSHWYDDLVPDESSSSTSDESSATYK